MGVSTRHTRRILAAYRRDGAAAIAHGNRGHRPANATPETVAADVVVLARTRYAGVNHTHLSELLREREGIDIGRNTLRKILTDAGVNSPRRRRPPKHRVRRQRMAREGMLIQIDGSYHRWLGEDGPQFTLLLAVDDATGCIVNALFCEVGSRLPCRGRSDVSRKGTVLEVQAQSRQRQHCQIPLAHPAAAAWHGPTELRRSSRRCVGGVGR